MNNQWTEPHAASALRATENCVIFAAICPKCRKQVLQHGYSRMLLLAFLDFDHPIEVYCAPCDEISLISAEERRTIVDSLSPART